MDAREDIGRRIHRIKGIGQYAGDVAVRHLHAEIEPVWIDVGNDQKDRHSGIENRNHPQIVAFIAEEEVNKGKADKWEPHIVKDNEPFIERERMIEAGGENMGCLARINMLDDIKTDQIKDGIR